MNVQLPSPAKELLIQTFEDPELLAHIAEMQLTEQEATNLAHNLSLLWGRGSLRLWPEVSHWEAMERHELLREAGQAAQRAIQAEEAAGGPVFRDSVSMMLELMHAAQDPAVLRNNPEDWLWGPVGPPIKTVPQDTIGANRYEAHAQKIGRAWNKKIARMSVRHEVKTCESILNQAGQATEVLPQAVQAGYDALDDVDPLVEESRRVAAEAPDGPWPEAMLEWSEQCWSATDTLRTTTETVIQAAASAGVVRTIDAVETNEERGIFVSVERARPLALLRWWQQIAPKRPDPDPSPSLSFWYTPQNPVDYWGACMTAALLELGRSRYGSVEGMAMALVNR